MQMKIRFLIFLILFIVVFYSILLTYWIFTTKYNKAQQNLHKLRHKNLSKLNKIKKNIPWYFKDGKIRPTKAKVSGNVWPDKQSGDRVEEQLMFVPPNYQYDDAPLKTILLYNDHIKWKVKGGQSEFVSKDCPVNRCTITINKMDAPNVDAIIFRDKFSEPVHQKSDKQIWILFILQSAYKSKLNVNKDVINWTATYRHDSDIVVPYARWAYYDPLVTQKPTFITNNARIKKSKQVAMFVSKCDGSNNNRLLYAKKLNKYINVDVYGDCDVYDVIHRDYFLNLLDLEYKFYLAFEDSNCVDYVTDIFFVNGLQHNVLPIVMGGRIEDYERMAPKQSYVHVDDFESPDKLADYLHQLDADDQKYNEYFRWKGTGEFIDTKFFCRLCAMLHDDGAPRHFYENVNYWWRKQDTCDETAPDMRDRRTDINNYILEEYEEKEEIDGMEKSVELYSG